MSNSAETAQPTNGEYVVSAVERIAATPEQIRRDVFTVLQSVGGDRGDAARNVIDAYAGRVALVSGLSTLPSCIPGVGTAVALIAGVSFDMVMTLKYEVDLCMSLAAVRGHDMRNPNERRIAFLLAAASVYEFRSGQSPIVDDLHVLGTAAWNYGPRELTKFASKLAASVALIWVSRGAIRFVPVVGSIAAAATASAMTSAVGRRADALLVARQNAPAQSRQPVTAPA